MYIIKQGQTKIKDHQRITDNNEHVQPLGEYYSEHKYKSSL